MEVLYAARTVGIVARYVEGKIVIFSRGQVERDGVCVSWRCGEDRRRGAYWGVAVVVLVFIFVSVAVCAVGVTGRFFSPLFVF